MYPYIHMYTRLIFRLILVHSIQNPQKPATLGIARQKQQRKSCLSKHCCIFRVDYMKT